MESINVNFFNFPTLKNFFWNSMAIMFVHTNTMSSDTNILKTLSDLVLFFFFFLFSRLISWPLLTVHLILQIWAMNNFKILTNLLPQKHCFLLLKILILSSVLSLMDYLLLVIQRSIRCHLLPEALASSCFNSIHLCGSVVKNLPAMRETQIWSLGQEDHDPLRRKWLPTTVFLPGKPHGQRNLAGYSSRGGKELDMTSWLKTTKQLIQYSWCPYKKGKKKTEKVKHSKKSV